MIKFRCCYCNQKIGVPDESAGKRCKCTKCEKVINIPNPESISEPELEGFSEEDYENIASGKNPINCVRNSSKIIWICPKKVKQKYLI